MTGSGQDAEERRTGEPSSVRLMLLTSFGFTVVTQALTSYPEGGLAPHLLWLGVTAMLLWIVHGSRSNAARLILVVVAVLGAVVYAAAYAMEREGRAVLLSLLYLAQAGPLLTAAVRRHVAGRHDADPAATPPHA